MIILYSLLIVLFSLVIILSTRLVTITHDIDSISMEIKEIVGNDTNIVLSTSSGERSIKNLVHTLNMELLKLNNLKAKYSKGLMAVQCSAESVSHDIRTPLTAIKGYIGLLDKESLSDEGRNYLEIIKGRVEYMKVLTDELFLSLSMKNRGILDLKDVDYKALLEEALVSFRCDFEKKGIWPKVIVGEERIIGKADEKALYRVFLNIISNALKYGEGDFVVEMKENGDTVFSNYAPGMDKIEAARLLDRYYTISDAKASSGIGLSISKEMVEEMGGKLGVDLLDQRLYISITFQRQVIE